LSQCTSECLRITGRKQIEQHCTLGAAPRQQQFFWGSGSVRISEGTLARRWRHPFDKLRASSECSGSSGEAKDLRYHAVCHGRSLAPLVNTQALRDDSLCDSEVQTDLLPLFCKFFAEPNDQMSVLVKHPAPVLTCALRPFCCTLRRHMHRTPTSEQWSTRQFPAQHWFYFPS
jgi:hypothetical protein